MEPRGAETFDGEGAVAVDWALADGELRDVDCGASVRATCGRPPTFETDDAGAFAAADEGRTGAGALDLVCAAAEGVEEVAVPAVLSGRPVIVRLWAATAADRTVSDPASEVDRTFNCSWR